MLLGLLDILPGLTPEADPNVLYTALKHVQRLQMTGSSNMCRHLVEKAFEVGNKGINYAGEVSGLNKFQVKGISLDDPAITKSLAHSICNNNGELCTSVSAIEVDTDFCSLEDAKNAIEKVQLRTGDDITDASIQILKRPDKAASMEIFTSGEIKEFWDKKAVAIPLGSYIIFQMII